MSTQQTTQSAPKDRHPDKTARRNLAIINGQRKGRLRFPKYGGGSGHVTKED